MLNISQAGGDTVNVQLDPEQGRKLREYIERNINCRFSTYVRKVGIAESNIHAMLRGTKKMSVKTLNRLLSCTDLELECRVEFQIQRKSGEAVQDASSPSLEEELLYEIGEESETEHLTEEEDLSTGTENLLNIPNPDSYF